MPDLSTTLQRARAYSGSTQPSTRPVINWRPGETIHDLQQAEKITPELILA